MSGEPATGTEQSSGTRDTRRFVWLLDPKLVTTAIGSLVVIVLAGLVQVSFGAYTMSIG